MKQVLCEILAEKIKENIQNDIWKPGEKMPGELELAQQYCVGRSTVREALHILQEQRMIEKKNGVGTFVTSAHPVIENPLLRLDSVGKMIATAGCEAKSVEYRAWCETVEPQIAHILQMGEQENVVVLNRGRAADDNPVAYSYNFMPQKYVGDAFDDRKAESIFRTLQEKCKIQIAYAMTEICGIDPKKGWDVAAIEFLQSPVVLLKQLHFDQDDRPVMYSYDYLNTDLIKLNLRRNIM